MLRREIGKEQRGMDRLSEIRERFAGSPFHSEFVGVRLDRVAPDEVDVSLDVEPRI
jgi:hypothetical protein